MEDIELSEELRKELSNAASGGPIATRRKTDKERRAERKARRESGEDRVPVPTLRPQNAVPSRKKGQRNAEEVHQVLRASKRKRKALAKIEEDKRRKERRKQLLAALADNQLSSAEQGLLRSSALLGTKETRKDVLLQDLRRERAGLDQVPVVTAEGDGDDVEMPLAAPAETKRKRRREAANVRGKAVTAQLVSVAESDKESDSESEDGQEEEAAKAEAAAAAAAERRAKAQADALAAAKEKAAAEAQAAREAAEEAKLAERKRSQAERMRAIAAIDDTKTRFVVRVERAPQVQEQRQQLPVCLMEQEIMETVQKNCVTVLCGETGSGKTTQLPQFLFEAGYGCPDAPDPGARGLVCVTQPRRVATVSMARRVGHELGANREGSPYYGSVGYQIRHDRRTVTENTRIKFMTDGVLLREARDDLLLKRYSVIILDEAHERNLNTDVLLGLLSRVVPLRERMASDPSVQGVYPLRVIIMSATLRVDDFAKNPRLFTDSPPPVVNVQARQYPVTTHFSRRTELRNYLETTFKKVCAIHKRLPPGGVLVFLTGQREIEYLCRVLREKFVNEAPRADKAADKAADAKAGAKKALADKDGEEKAEEDIEFSDIESESDESDGAANSDEDEDEDDNVAGPDDDDGGDDGGDVTDGKKGKRKSKEKGKKGKQRAEKTVPLSAAKRIKAASARINTAQVTGHGPLHVLPLFSRLPTAEQMKVFQEVPEGHRLVVVSTNVAETSVTIPGIRYVVDCGREKRKVHDQVTGCSKFEIGWISQASANQRMGRAGRTGPGHCYRLYSSAVFNDHFEPFAAPEIANLPIEDVVLYMKTMGIDKVESFPFPSPPDLNALLSAEQRLLQLGALERRRQRRLVEAYDGGDVEITPLGRRITKFPVRARFGKMLAVAACDTQQSPVRLSYVVAVVAALSLQEPFLHMQVIEEGRGVESAADQSAESADGGSKAPDAAEEARRQRVEEALEVKAKWHDAKSDAISLLKAAGAYAHVVAFQSNRQGDLFCRGHMLHFKTMREQMQLRGQLAKTVAQMNLATIEADAAYTPDSDDEELEDQAEAAEDDEVEHEAPTAGATTASSRAKRVAALATRLRGPLPPPTDADKVYLQQVLAAGFLDQVARKMTKDEARAVSSEDDFRLKRRWPYVSCASNIEYPVFIHPHSNVHSKSQAELPDFVTYGHVDVVEQQPHPPANSDQSEDEAADDVELPPARRIHYMKQVTAVHASWLHQLSEGTEQCTLSAVQEQPAPRFNSAKDCLEACVHPLFGPKRWKLPAQWMPFPVADGDAIRARARWFGRCLLEGKVLPLLAEARAWLAVPPAYMTRKLHEPRVEALTRALCAGPRRKGGKKKRPVFTRAALFAAWDVDPSFLLPELVKWVQKAHLDELRALWARLRAS